MTRRLVLVLAALALSTALLAIAAVASAAPSNLAAGTDSGRQAVAHTLRMLSTAGSSDTAAVAPDSAQAGAAAAAAGPLTISAPPDVVVGEKDGAVTLNVQLSAESADPVLVSYTTTTIIGSSGTVCGSSSNNPDFAGVSTPQQISFPAGHTVAPVSIALIDCMDTEPIAAFTLNLSSASGATIARSSTLVTIVDRTTVVSKPRLFARNVVVDQKDAATFNPTPDPASRTILVPVLLGGAAGQSTTAPVTVDYATADGTAVAGTDYLPVSGTLTFDPGENVASVAVPILDAGPKSSTTFTLTLKNPSNNAEISDATANVVIGSAPLPLPGAQPTVSAPPDVVVGEGDGYVDLPIRLSAPAQDPVLVDYSTQSSTANSGTACSTNGDFGSRGLTTVRFAPGETTKVVRVPLLDCTEVDGLVSFRLNLSNAQPTTIQVARTSTLVSIVNNHDGGDVLTPRIQARDAVVDEKDGSVQVPVLLGGPAGQRSSSSVRVQYATVARTATPGVDYTHVSGTLTFAPGQTVKNVVVPILNAGAHAPRTFALSLSGPENATISDPVGTITIGASAAASVPQPALSAPPDVVVGEGDGWVDLPVRLSAPGTSPVTVNYTTPNVGATPGTSCNSADYVTAPTGSFLTFAPGETTKVVRVQLLDCPDVEGFGSFRLTLNTPGNATILRATTLISIVNNDTVVTTPQGPGLFVRDAVLDEKDGSVLVPVLLGAPAGQASTSTVTVQYATSDGTATANVDYSPLTGTLTFAPGQTVKTLVVPIFDVGPKPTRRFTVTLTGATNATIADGTGTVTIGASTAVPVAQPTLSAPADIVVGEFDGYVDLPVRLSAPGLNPITVSYDTFSSTASSGTTCGTPPGDYVSATGTLNFVPGETTKVVRIQLLDCADVEGLISFRFTLSSPNSNATIARATTLVSIVNDSTVVTTPRVVVRDAIVDQKDAFVLVPVLLGGPTGQASDSTVTVDYATSDGTATANVDYTPVHGTLHFAPGQTVKNVLVPILDAGPKPSTSFELGLSNVTNATPTDTTGVITIGSSDQPAVSNPVISSAAPITVAEADGYVDVDIRLSAPGASPVSVNFTTTNMTATGGTLCDNDYVTTSGVLTFAPGETLKAVRVQLLDCPDVESTVTFRLSLSSPSPPATINAMRAQTVVSIANDASAFAPTNTALPTVTGTVRPGQTLTASTGTWTGTPTSFQTSWQRCAFAGGNCSPIAGATGSTYVVTDADLGRRLRVEVFATNAIGTSFPAYSIPSAAYVIAPGAPIDVTAAAGDGKAYVSFSPPPADGGGVDTYTVTSSGGQVASGATSPILVAGLTNGTSYTFTVTATNSAGTGPASAPSNAVIPVRRAPRPPDPPPPAPRPTTPDPPVGLPRPPRP